MRVKIGETIYDSNEQPVMIILSPTEKRQIAHMGPMDTKYCVYRAWTADADALKKWMEDV